MTENRLALLYCTTKNQQEAERIGEILVIEKLAACINILPSMTSLYQWEGKLEKSREAVMIVKTTQLASEQAIQRIEELHSYDCPAIVQLPIETGSTEYLDWIKTQVSIDNKST